MLVELVLGVERSAAGRAAVAETGITVDSYHQQFKF